MANYNVYLSGVKYSVDVSPDATLSELRNTLSKQTNEVENYNFVYYNDFTDQKTILNDRSVENKQHVKKIVFDDSTIIMTIVKGSKTDLFGNKADWLHDRHTGVKISLNFSDEEGKKRNQGKFEPIMLTDVQPSNESSDAFYQRVVICEKGSLVEFNISSWGAAGFGYSIVSDKDTICEELYNSYGNDQNRKGYSTLRRYKESKNTIEIDSTKTLDIPTKDVVHYQKVTVKTWRMTSYKENGTTYSSNMEAPKLESQNLKSAPFRSIQTFSFAATSGGFDPGSPSGTVYVPGKDIETAAPARGPESQQSFGTISNVKEDDKNSKVLGAVVFYFFVFKDKASAQKVINILNAPNPDAIG